MPNPGTDDPVFWGGIAGFGSPASRFTVPFGERALAEAELAPGANLLDIATGKGAQLVIFKPIMRTISTGL